MKFPHNGANSVCLSHSPARHSVTALQAFHMCTYTWFVDDALQYIVWLCHGTLTSGCVSGRGVLSTLQPLFQILDPPLARTLHAMTLQEL